MFPGGFCDKKDYSGFDLQNWFQQTGKHRLKIAEKMKQSNTISEEKCLSKQHRISHWSALLKLKYFDVVRFVQLILCTMFLVTAKYVFKHRETTGNLGKNS